MESKYLGVIEAATYLGVSRHTLRRWEDAGAITPLRTPTNARRYTKAELDAILTRPTT